MGLSGSSSHKSEGGRYVLEDSSNIVEYAVKMRRIHDHRLLKNRLGEVSEEEVKRLARHIANFHLRAEKKPEFGKLEVMKFNTDENFIQTEKYIGITIKEGHLRIHKGENKQFL